MVDCIVVSASGDAGRERAGIRSWLGRYPPRFNVPMLSCPRDGTGGWVGKSSALAKRCRWRSGLLCGFEPKQLRQAGAIMKATPEAKKLYDPLILRQVTLSPQAHGEPIEPRGWAHNVAHFKMPRNTNTAKAQPSGWLFPGKSVQSLFCFFCETIDSLIQRRFSHNGKTLKEFARCFVQEKILYITIHQFKSKRLPYKVWIVQ